MVLKEEEEEEVLQGPGSGSEENDENASALTDEGDEDIIMNEQGPGDEIESANESGEDTGDDDTIAEEGEEKTPKPAELTKAELRKLKKIGPQQQKKLIHTLFKRAKIYEIRKLTRRITTLKSAKGTDEQVAKNQRKADRLSKEIECMREFMIDKLVERSIVVFKGKAESDDTKLWESCQTPTKTNDMIQVLAESEADHLQDIAFLRMLSSKDIVGKFQRISQGENLLSRNRKKKKKKSKGKPSKGDKAPIENDDKEENSAPKKDSITKKTNTKPKEKAQSTKASSEKVQKENKSIEKDVVSKPTKPKKMKKDSFFVDHEVEGTDSGDNESMISDDEEFTAPVKYDASNPDILNPKKNRMGQRERKKLQDKKYGREPSDRGSSRGRGFSRGRGGQPRGGNQSRGGGRFDRGQGRGGFRGGRGREGFNGNTRGGMRQQASFGSKSQAVVKKVDENLHPSWQAKQKQKAQQSITGFSGTKITFDD